MLCQVSKQPHNRRIQLLPKRIVHGPQFQVHQCIVEIGNAASVELIR